MADGRHIDSSCEVTIACVERHQFQYHGVLLLLLYSTSGVG